VRELVPLIEELESTKLSSKEKGRLRFGCLCNPYSSQRKEEVKHLSTLRSFCCKIVTVTRPQEENSISGLCAKGSEREVGEIRKLR